VFRNKEEKKACGCLRVLQCGATTKSGAPSRRYAHAGGEGRKRENNKNASRGASCRATGIKKLQRKTQL
jgi:hypothetical protein